jgi:hypothetical protein
MRPVLRRTLDLGRASSENRSGEVVRAPLDHGRVLKIAEPVVVVGTRALGKGGADTVCVLRPPGREGVGRAATRGGREPLAGHGEGLPGRCPECGREATTA